MTVHEMASWKNVTCSENSGTGVAKAVRRDEPGMSADSGCAPSIDALSNGAGKSLPWSLPNGKCTSGVCCGSFGELLQGILPGDDREFLVTLPIEKYAVAHFFPREGSEMIEVFPSWKTKSLQLASGLLRMLSRRVGGQLYLASEIPCGKGLSSSSADLVATARAIESYLGVRIPMDELCRSLSQVEPTGKDRCHKGLTHTLLSAAFAPTLAMPLQPMGNSAGERLRVQWLGPSPEYSFGLPGCCPTTQSRTLTTPVWGRCDEDHLLQR